MWAQMKAFLESFFIYEGLNWDMMLIAIGLALVFGAVWLCTHWPPLFKKHWLWAVAVVSAFLALLAVTFVQIPLQHYVGVVLNHFWDQGILMDWVLLAGIPSILLSGLVQEGAKMIPIVFWWWRSGMNITPRLGLAIGAIAGAGFGIFAFGGFLEVVDGAFYLAASVTADFFAVLFHRLFRRVDELVGLILKINDLSSFLVLFGVRLGVLCHFLNLALAEPGAGFDFYRLLLAGAKVFG